MGSQEDVSYGIWEGWKKQGDMWLVITFKDWEENLWIDAASVILSKVIWVCF